MTGTVFLAAIFTIAILALALIDKVQRRNMRRIERPPETDRPYHFDQSIGPDEDPEEGKVSDGD